MSTLPKEQFKYICIRLKSENTVFREKQQKIYFITLNIIITAKIMFFAILFIGFIR